MRRAFGHLRIGTGPRHAPSACSEILKKNRARYGARRRGLQTQPPEPRGAAKAVPTGASNITIRTNRHSANRRRRSSWDDDWEWGEHGWNLDPRMDPRQSGRPLSFFEMEFGPGFTTSQRGARIYFEQLFGACRRQTPRARFESEGSIGKVWVRRVFGYLQIDAGPRRAPSACSETLKKNALGPSMGRLSVSVYLLRRGGLLLCLRTRGRGRAIRVRVQSHHR